MDQWVGAMSDPASPVVSTAMTPVFAGVTLVGLLILAAFLRGTRHPAVARGVPAGAVTG